MADKIRKLDNIWMFYCPACERAHPFDTRWTWNGSLDKPTFTPSLRVDQGRSTECHTNITEGFIQYHADCKHKLAGQKIEMLDWQEGYW